MFVYSHNVSISNNNLYGIHSSNVSFVLALALFGLFVHGWGILNAAYIWCPFATPFIHFMESLLLAWWIISGWLYDLYVEGYYFLTWAEQSALITGVKLLIVSEFFLFLTCFWSYINFRLISHILVFPSISLYTFSIPFSNLLLLLFSSLPLQSAYIHIKLGYLYEVIHGLVKVVMISYLFLLLQIKEFFFSLMSINDTFLGSIYYFTTGLHGSHVLLGGFLLFSLLWFILVGRTQLFFTEMSLSLLLTSYYWHFVDIIWFIVFLLYIV